MGPRATRTLARLSGAVLLALLTGCSTMRDLAGLPHAGHQPDGSYVLTDEQRGEGCRLLRERATKLVAGFAAVPDTVVAEQNATPSTMSAVLKRTFGAPGDGIRAQENFKRSYAEAVAINEALVEKGCEPVDIEGQFGGQQRLAPTPTTMTH